MLTVKQAKEMGVVFVKGDVIEGDSGRTYAHDWFTSTNGRFESCQVTSFTDRNHAGDEMPCDGNLPVIVYLHIAGERRGFNAGKFDWLGVKIAGAIISWKPDLEVLEELVNKKKEKPMTQKQYTYELVTDLSTNEIAKAMIDGEVFYSKCGKFEYTWNGNSFIDSRGLDVAITGEFYRKKEIEIITRTITYPKPVSEPLNIDDVYYRVDGDKVNRFEWNNDRYDNADLKQDRIHLTKENAQAHWDALFGGK